MRFAPGDDDAAVCRVEVHAKHRVVGALKAKEGGDAVATRARAVVSNAFGFCFEHTFTSASLSSLCQSQTERTWSLDSSTAQSVFPPF